MYNGKHYMLVLNYFLGYILLKYCLRSNVQAICNLIKYV